MVASVAVVESAVFGQPGRQVGRAVRYLPWQVLFRAPPAEPDKRFPGRPALQ